MVQIRFHVKGLQFLILAQIQRMVGMPLFGDGAGAVPAGAVFPANLQHIPDALGQILPFLNNSPPGRPYGGGGREGENIAEGFHVFMVKSGIAGPFHGIRVCGPLGIDVEHEKAVKAVAQSDSLHGFQRVVQLVRSGGGRVDADADQGPFAPGCPVKTASIR